MKLNINNKSYLVKCNPDDLLIDIIREDLRLTGAKNGCGIGVCGTCSVLINGNPKRACIVKMSQIKETDNMITIEGLEDKTGKLHPIQQAFIDAGAVQCGFCTPGLILVAKAFLDKNPNPTRDEIKKAFSTVLCRCTGYQQVFEAVDLVVKQTGDVDKSVTN